jgi:hypothetical protein
MFDKNGKWIGLETVEASNAIYALRKTLGLLACASCVVLLQACAVVAVADAAVTVVATGVKITAKAVGAVADAVIPDGK